MRHARSEAKSGHRFRSPRGQATRRGTPAAPEPEERPRHTITSTQGNPAHPAEQR